MKCYISMCVLKAVYKLCDIDLFPKKQCGVLGHYIQVILDWLKNSYTDMRSGKGCYPLVGLVMLCIVMLCQGLVIFSDRCQNHSGVVFIRQVGGGALHLTTFLELQPYMVKIYTETNQQYYIESYAEQDRVETFLEDPSYIVCNATLKQLLQFVSVDIFCEIAALHQIEKQVCKKLNRLTRANIILALANHDCTVCYSHFAVFKPHLSNHSKGCISAFPPDAPSKKLQHKIISEFCNETNLKGLEEGICAVCGELKFIKNLKSLQRLSLNLDILKQAGVTRIERLDINSPILEYTEPILVPGCKTICTTCDQSLSDGKRPKLALANGIWIGSVPQVLKDLRFAERLLIARVRHNNCIVRVASGGRKLKANAILFENPMQKIYNKLPPPVEEIDTVLAYIFTGPVQPTADELKRTPLLVRRKAILRALEWLIINHNDYADLCIDHDALQKYPEDGFPVSIEYIEKNSNKISESVSLHDNEPEDGTEYGDCLFTVHGITGEELSSLSSGKLLRIKALQHLNSKGKFLAIGHNPNPESIYHNIHLYPQIFPWLFPYGLGGIGMGHGISEKAQKKHLLLYYDRRFQKDPHFPLIAFNHEQIKNTTTSSFLLTESENFEKIADRVLSIKPDVIDNIIQKIESSTGKLDISTDEEKNCFKLLNDLECVSSKINGSASMKRLNRTEIWSLISYKGAPIWFITLSPADVKNPICIFWASGNLTLYPSSISSDDRMRLIANNPVAAARFFHFIVMAFVKYVLGVGSGHSGFYGETSAYYGTVEQQGRLTLHLHLLLWIAGSLTPQELREKIMENNSTFNQALINYLENVQQGEFFNGKLNEVADLVNKNAQTNNYIDPTMQQALIPPPFCEKNHINSMIKCSLCQNTDDWWKSYYTTVDDIVLRSNVHTCGSGLNKDGNKSSFRDYIGCLNNKFKKCKARFPRALFPSTIVDVLTGRIDLKKKEEYINTFSPILTYLLRCNTDVTCLLSGTAVKAVVAYVSDYISKNSLNTYVIFDVIRNVYRKNSEIIQCSDNRPSSARKLLTKIVNSLTVKMEIGAPMASLYLLDQPDHYTDHKFVPFYWQNYVTFIWKKCEDVNDSSTIVNQENKVVILKANGRLYPSRYLDDYRYRPEIYSTCSLYDWIRLYRRRRIPQKKNLNNSSDDIIDEKNLDESDRYETDDEEIDIQDIAIEDEDSSIDVYDDLENITKKEKWFNFLNDHPLNKTHHVTCVRNNDKIVPNFLGGSLPRLDKGNDEYYYCSMLVFFKPWRDIEDLKLINESWERNFQLHDFSKRYKDIMKFFNVRYECLDARDDYSALSKVDRSNLNEHILSQEDQNCIDLENTIGDIKYDLDDNDNEKYLYESGRVGNLRSKNMASIKLTLQLIGWLDYKPQDRQHIVVKDIWKPSIYKSPKEWRNEVTAQRQMILTGMQQTSESLQKKSIVNNREFKVENDVKILDIDNFGEKGHKKLERKQALSVCQEFDLNDEQLRAYNIIAEYILEPQPENLKMYLGGMGGTGKTRVFKAVQQLLKYRNESNRLLIMAPTGTAAALLGGSTYHSVLGIQDQKDKPLTRKAIAQIKDRLDGRDIIFFDEVSMLSAFDMYRFCERLAIGSGNTDSPFGGFNIVFAGDFAQLPPVFGGESVSLYSGLIGSSDLSAITPRGQKSAIGKAMWHQITTVVILRKNMRQKDQTLEDSQLRTALENMRYKACTPSDSAFLQKLIVPKNYNSSNNNLDKFDHVSIITARNDQKDKINELGIMKFAAKTGQKIYSFYSIDSLAKEKPDNAESKKNHRLLHYDTLTPAIQEILWKQIESANDAQIPGKLDLCIDMPIMIKYNDATELCITRGQEGTVFGWESSIGPHGKPVLDVLFVLLSNPAQDVQLHGLPLNVVPLTRSSKYTPVTLPSGYSIAINREQILCSPNFAMSDFGSQGRTRGKNPVHLEHCHSHQSYYTCLSRSSSAKNTIIIGNIDHSKIKGYASGWLRQEFRELEILDFITKLKYEDKLPSNILHNTRSKTIKAFQVWKGKDFNPDGLHKAIQWSAKTFQSSDDIDHPWKIVGRKKYGIEVKKIENNVKEKAENTDILKTTGEKRKQSDNININLNPRKSKKSRINSVPYYSPVGLKWDSLNYSCAYDSLFGILLHIWIDNPTLWSAQFQTYNSAMIKLSHSFLAYSIKQITIENARDYVRKILYEADSAIFPQGSSYISVHDLATKLFIMQQNLYQTTRFCRCGWRSSYLSRNQSSAITILGSSEASIDRWINEEHALNHTCHSCKEGSLYEKFHFNVCPPILYVDIENTFLIDISRYLDIQCGSQLYRYDLKGIIYYNNHHYTCRFISSDKIWFHDGMITGNLSIPESFRNLNLNYCGVRTATAAIYSLRQ